MSTSTLEVADILRAHDPAELESRGIPVSLAQRRVWLHIVDCRTAALGGHVYRCSECEHEEIAYNSCRDRHCPKCQAAARHQWLLARERDLLPVEYFHVVFTLPATVADIALQNKATIYKLLMTSAAQTLKQIGADSKNLGGELGFLMVLHTWGQNLHHHPHVHCVIPGGALSSNSDRWISCPRGFFLPVKVLSPVFRGKFLDGLCQLYERGELVLRGSLSSLEQREWFFELLDALYGTPWVVYSKRPFGGPSQVLRYLARYTHRVAIANNRIKAFEGDRVTFSWKNYKKGQQRQDMTLMALEFIRRFLLHVLPKRFVRIRYGGFLASRAKHKLELCRRLIGELDKAMNTTPPEPGTTVKCSKETNDELTCPVCKKGVLRIVRKLQPQIMARAPPYQLVS